MGKGIQYLPRLDRVTGTKGTDLTERDFIGLKAIAFLRNQPTLPPPAH